MVDRRRIGRDVRRRGGRGHHARVGEQRRAVPGPTHAAVVQARYTALLEGDGRAGTVRRVHPRAHVLDAAGGHARSGDERHRRRQQRREYRRRGDMRQRILPSRGRRGGLAEVLPLRIEVVGILHVPHARRGLRDEDEGRAVLPESHATVHVPRDTEPGARAPRTRGGVPRVRRLDPHGLPPLEVGVAGQSEAAVDERRGTVGPDRSRRHAARRVPDDVSQGQAELRGSQGVSKI